MEVYRHPHVTHQVSNLTDLAQEVTMLTRTSLIPIPTYINQCPRLAEKSDVTEPEVSVLRSEIRRLQNDLATAQAQLRRIESDLATERVVSACYLKERDAVFTTAHAESARLTAELTTERAISTRFMHERDKVLEERRSARPCIILSSYIGDYTSEFLDAKTASQRAALLAAIESTTKMMWDSGVDMTWQNKVQVIRTMMLQHSFVFRDPDEGQTGWEGYAMKVPDVGAVEQLDRVVRTIRVGLGIGWYLVELIAVLLRVGQYLESHP